MKYENGRDLFPEDLLRQIQKYVSGRLVYIPSSEKKRAWGETSGYKQYLSERNRDIREKFYVGAGIEELADAYCLSCETIKKIVYTKKEAMYMQYRCALSSAKEYARQGRLEEWVHLYLLSDGHNREFSEGLKLYERRYLGPMRMPLSLFKRCCGPEETMRWQVDKAWFEKHVSELQEVIQRERDMPPLIVHYFIDAEHTDGCFELNDGNHRLEAYTRLGIEEYEVVVWITEKSEYDSFVKKYAEYMD
ncbi:MAG: ParB N-terminal domain-containing protein [Oscillospiraceae bacterium]|nr:ParB N-terminal domain-containing protein [Oscillospiraceae bacterium]